MQQEIRLDLLSSLGNEIGKIFNIQLVPQYPPNAREMLEMLSNKETIFVTLWKFDTEVSRDDSIGELL